MADTRQQILTLARAKLQTYGYNGFSFGDLAREIGIKTASIHYHFPSKEDLGVALVEHYIADLHILCARLEREFDDERDRLKGYIASFRATLSQDRFCLCGMLRAEDRAIPKSVRAAVVRYFEDSTRWLAARFEAGREQGIFAFEEAPEQIAIRWLAMLEGLLLVPLPRHRDDFDAAADRLLCDLEA